jgi:hypothetical protein
MLMIAASTATVTAFAAAVVSFVLGLAAGRHAHTVPHDTDTAIREITEKVRHPWVYRAKRLVRW